LDEMPPVVDQEIERPQEILSETAAHFWEKIGVIVDDAEIQATHGCTPHRNRIGLSKRRDCLSLSRLQDHLSRRRKRQFFNEFSVDDCIGTTGIDQEVKRTGSIDGDGNDNHLRHHPELDLERLLAKARGKVAEAERDKGEKASGETE
jgi:hypothetical protein